MKIKIRSKLVLAISLLMVVIFSLAAFLFIKEKKTEMAEDIYLNTLAFSKLTASTVAYNYDLYLEQGGFVYFNREVQSLFEKNDDISAIRVVSYTGEILYDSSVDVDKKYEGEVRIIDDQDLLDQVRSENISLRTLDDGRIVFIKTDDRGNVSYVDQNDTEVEPLETGTLLDFLIVPANEKYSVTYVLDYHNLNERVDVMMRRIIYLAVFGILLGMLFSFFMSSKVTKPVAKLVEGAEGIAKGDFKTRVDIETEDEIGFLGDSFNKMAKDLEISVEARLYKERVTHELELAKQIQDQLIPGEDKIPKIGGLDVSAGLISAAEIGGDMYDFLSFDKNRLLMYLGDVTGHGVPAGIVSSIASALFYGYSGCEDLKKIMLDVNRVLKVKTMPNMFMTLCLMEWNVSDGKFKYVNAGHEQLIHYKAKEGKAELTPIGGIALGMLPDISTHIKVEEMDLQPGDFLIVYSDGIPEAWRSEKENYGMERFLKSVERLGQSQDAVAMKEGILSDLQEFVSGYNQLDDITLIVVKRV